jgi:hypothetical protein
VLIGEDYLGDLDGDLDLPSFFGEFLVGLFLVDLIGD